MSFSAVKLGGDRSGLRLGWAALRLGCVWDELQVG